MDQQQLEEIMMYTLRLAAHSRREVAPPYVGAVVLDRNGKIIGEGYKRLLEGTLLLLHAERVALDAAGDAARGGTLITTLEPCVSVRKNQVFVSCSELIVERGIAQVIFYEEEMRNASGGMTHLRQHGVQAHKYQSARLQTA